MKNLDVKPVKYSNDWWKMRAALVYAANPKLRDKQFISSATPRIPTMFARTLK
jgi:hypothetical protein